MNTARVGEIPIRWVEPKRAAAPRTLVLWLPGFSGTKDSTAAQLDRLAEQGYVALSWDCYQHGERRIGTQEELVTRVRGNIRRFFWPILARSAEESTQMIDWALRELKVRDVVGMGGTSMGGDISVAAAGVDRRIRAVSAIVATPDWMRPGSFEPPGEPDEIAQEHYRRRNPLTNLDAYRHRPAIAFQSGRWDHQVPPDGGERFVEVLRRGIYRDAPERLRVNLFDAPHGFVPPMWDATVEWLAKWLK